MQMGNAKLLGAMQEALTSLLSISAHYHMYYKDVVRFGLSMAEDVHKLGEQAEAHANELTARIFLYDGQPEYELDTITPATAIDGMLKEMLDLELGFDAKCWTWIQLAEAEGDGTMFHWFQHLSKWHTTGGNEYDIGPVSWLKKQLWQINKIGLQQYLASQVTK